MSKFADVTPLALDKPSDAELVWNCHYVRIPQPPKYLEWTIEYKFLEIT